LLKLFPALKGGFTYMDNNAGGVHTLKPVVDSFLNIVSIAMCQHGERPMNFAISGRKVEFGTTEMAVGQCT
jgi:hypothetical protein